MDVIYELVVVTHLLGMAAVVGGYLVAARGTVAPNGVMLWGARAQIITGLALVGLGEGAGVWDDDQPSYVKIGIKLVVALAVAGLTETAMARRATRDVSTLTHLAGGLAIANVLVAVLVS